MTDPLHQAEEVFSLEDLISSARTAIEELQATQQNDEPIAMLFVAMNAATLRVLYRQAPPARCQYMLASAQYVLLRETWGARS